MLIISNTNKVASMAKKNVITEEDLKIADRLKQIWDRKKDQLGLSQEKAAGILGFSTQAAISQFLNGKTSLNTENILKFSALLDVAPEEINPSIGPLLAHVRATAQTTNYKDPTPAYGYPLISWVQAGAFSEIDGSFTERDAIRLVDSTKRAGNNAFWLEVKGDSMTAPVGVSFPEGMLILVDPDRAVHDGDLCVAYLTNKKAATFKKYVEDAGDHFLKPLNPAWPLTEINEDCRIIGKVIDATWEDLDS